ncbi:MAG: helix-turn-helix domain-containing protein [Pseudonocardia sp.]|nr:helix-turn-helix domain-containing protein [Pseudonocardia sp.]
MTEIPAPTLDDIRGWSATVDVPTACAAFGVSRSYGYELVKRGEFPARTLKVGGRVRVITASVLAELEGVPAA